MTPSKSNESMNLQAQNKRGPRQNKQFEDTMQFLLKARHGYMFVFFKMIIKRQQRIRETRNAQLFK